MPNRSRPGWAEKPASTDTRRLVTCGGCGETMPWRTFANGHLRECPAAKDPRERDVAAGAV